MWIELNSMLNRVSFSPIPDAKVEAEKQIVTWLCLDTQTFIFLLYEVVLVSKGFIDAAQILPPLFFFRFSLNLVGTSSLCLTFIPVIWKKLIPLSASCGYIGAHQLFWPFGAEYQLSLTPIPAVFLYLITWFGLWTREKTFNGSRTYVNPGLW